MADPLAVGQPLVPMRPHPVEQVQGLTRVVGATRESAALEVDLGEVDAGLGDERVALDRALQELGLQGEPHGVVVRDGHPVHVARLLLGLVADRGGAMVEYGRDHVQVLADALADPGDPVERHLGLHLPRVEQRWRLVAGEVAPQVYLDELVHVVSNGHHHDLRNLPGADVPVRPHEGADQHVNRRQARVTSREQGGVHEGSRQGAKVPGQSFGLGVHDLAQAVARGCLERVEGAEDEEVAAVDCVEEASAANLDGLAPSLEYTPGAPQVVGEGVARVRKVLEPQELLQEGLHYLGPLRIPRLELLLENDRVHWSRHRVCDQMRRVAGRLQGTYYAGAGPVLAIRRAARSQAWDHRQQHQ
mmetsp:Transcript_33264/g.88054  ORF Transcript_33264/g.88054 Transcript_33264/m.88054 type:complete len:360 (+) Transcript_33264:305-1384(+)